MRDANRNEIGIKKARIVALCILNAWLFVFVSGTVACGVMLVQRVEFLAVVREYIISLAVSAATTIIPSLILSMAIWPFVKRRDLSRCSTPFYVTTIASGLVLGVIGLPVTIILYALLLVLSATLWWFLPVVYETPGLCRRCGYDLTGNISGKCPECGSAIDQVVPKE